MRDKTQKQLTEETKHNSSKASFFRIKPTFAILSTALLLSSCVGPFKRSSPVSEGPIKQEGSFDQMISLDVGGEWKSLGDGIKIRVKKVRRFKRGEKRGQIATVNIDLKQRERYFQNVFIKGASGESIHFRYLKFIVLPTKGQKIKIGIIEQ